MNGCSYMFLLVLVRGRGQDFCIVRGDDRSHVLPSAVGDFHIAPIEEFRIGVVLGNVLGDEAEELGGYVG